MKIFLLNLVLWGAQAEASTVFNFDAKAIQLVNTIPYCQKEYDHALMHANRVGSASFAHPRGVNEQTTTLTFISGGIGSDTGRNPMSPPIPPYEVAKLEIIKTFIPETEPRPTDSPPRFSIQCRLTFVESQKN